MTTLLSERLQEWMGWCPMAAAVQQEPDRHPEDPAAGRGVRPGLPEAYQKPDRFTALSVFILFATLFFGGNIWWPPLVLGIAAAGILGLQVKSRSQEWS